MDKRKATVKRKSSSLRRKTLQKEEDEGADKGKTNSSNFGNKDTSSSSESDSFVDDSEIDKPKRNPKKFKSAVPSPVFIAIQLGAGVHSVKRKDLYKDLCKKACEKANIILVNGGTAGEAVAIATVELEDSGILNAGSGSSLTRNKTVECDAGFMNGNGYFGGVGAAPGLKNPVLVAKKIADLHEKEPLLSCGRVPPELLTGEGAKQWAELHGIPVCDNTTLVSKVATKAYEKYMQLMDANEDIHKGVNDTVGAVALDKNGCVASCVSSGGNWLKYSGRVGHSPQFGCGCWSSNGTEKGKSSIAVSSSGAGEMLCKVRLPIEIATLTNDKSYCGLVNSLSTVIQKNFLENDLLKIHKEQKNVGLISLLWDGEHGEFAWGHTSENFVIAYTGTGYKTTKMHFSTLPSNGEAGKSIKVEGIIF